MSELNEQQVELISAYIRQHGVASDELFEDLLDHVCTSIENLMVEGGSFEDAFAKTIKLFGPGGLKQVQQQTFELLTEMNENMKKVAFLFGLTSTFLLLAGTIFKLMHWPGAGIMLVLGGVLLALVYLPMLLWHKLKESPKDEYVLHISGFIGLASTTIGVLFKIMHWPGASISLLVGIGTLGIAYVPIYFFKKYRTSANKSITLSSALVAMTCLILVFGMMSFHNSRYFDRGLALIYNDMEASAEKINQNESLYERLAGNSEAEEIRSAVKAAEEMIEGLKLKLISETEGISISKAGNVQIHLMKQKDNFDIPSHILFAENSEFNAESLMSTISNFQMEILDHYPLELRDDISAIMPYDFEEKYQWNSGEVDWASWHFYNTPLSAILSQLSKMQLDIRNAETQVLLYLLSQPAASGPPSGS